MELVSVYLDLHSQASQWLAPCCLWRKIASASTRRTPHLKSFMLATTQADAPSSQHINNRGGQQQQQYYQGNYQGNYHNNQNRGRRRGRNNNYCGCGRNNWNNNQSGWVQQPSAWQSQPLQQYWQQKNWQQNQ
ncbi:hypothetical protein F2Q70_00038304 [Brassica cretica]|uniref:Uncharacterized protein n=1 Tax=Brassica cretica TaxID=69181 RepID=A0A8S9K6X6_BRACR|nr:hypothetical protein F2Q70_00038304 [Brassica cretica]